MMFRTTLGIVTAGIALLTPLSAFAGGAMAVVTVAPLGEQAPAINMAMIAVLAVLLAGIAMSVLRKRSATPAVGLTLVAVIAFAAIGYAIANTIVISGDECTEVTTELYNSISGGDQFLRSDCPNPIKIVELDPKCSSGEGLGEAPAVSCEVGLILNSGDTCQLPICH